MLTDLIPEFIQLHIKTYQRSTEYTTFILQNMIIYFNKVQSIKLLLLFRKNGGEYRQPEFIFCSCLTFQSPTFLFILFFNTAHLQI